MARGSSKLLTPKQRNFVSEYVANGGNGTQAALAAYNTESAKTASVIATENLDRQSIRRSIERALANHSITPDRLSLTLSEALEAHSTIPTGPGQSITEPNFQVRLKAVDLAAKLADLYPRESARHEHRHLHIESSDDPSVLRFKVLHGRAPTDREIADLRIHNSISTPQNETDKRNK